MEFLETSIDIHCLTLFFRPFDVEYLKYLNDLPSQFASLPVKNAYSSDLCSIAAVEDALKIRAAYAIYTSIIKGIVKDKPNFKAKILFNEIYQID